MINASNNSRYKTVICKHFEQNGTCHMGDRCHFAHGPEELRKADNSAPFSKKPTNNNYSKPHKNYPTYSVPPYVSNYKTVKCRFFEKGHCKFEAKCNYAHGDQDLRAPDNNSLPQQAMTTMQMNSMMYPMFDQATQNQINQQQISFLITQMEQHHRNDQEFMQKLKEAKELNDMGTIQSIINRPDASKDEEKVYSGFIRGMQDFGNYLTQQLQMAYYTQAMSSSYMMQMPQTMGLSGLFGANPELNQPKQFGSVGQGPQGKTPPRHMNQKYNKQASGDTEQRDLTNMMGGMQISNNGHNSKNQKPQQQHHETDEQN